MRHTGKQVEETMKKAFTLMKIIVVALIALVIGGTMIVYADEIPSNGVVAASAPAVETNGPVARTTSPGVGPFVTAVGSTCGGPGFSSYA
jgi:hypothetical protein